VPAFHVYEQLEAPDLEVEVDGQWWPDEARMRTTHKDGRLTYEVLLHRDGSTYLTVFQPSGCGWTPWTGATAAAKRAG